jgi:ribosome-associated toxin RatA of RatAB toxin-antitoxin module
MPKAFEFSECIAATPEALFALTQDYSRRLQWDPFLKQATLLDGATEAGCGVRALCVARSGLAMVTEYVSFKPPLVAAVKMTSGPRFLGEFAGSWRFQTEADGRTQVTFRYRLVTSPRWLGWLFGPLFNGVFRHDTQKRLRALKQAVEERHLLEDRH